MPQTQRDLERGVQARDCPADVGVVVIGRNEGSRLVQALRSSAPAQPRVLYSDSGSSDHSVNLAREHGFEAIALGPGIVPTAARARNDGFTALLERHPDTPFVQFLDGDSALEAAWLSIARGLLEADPATAVVCGRLREFRAARNLFRRLMDMEWDRPAGISATCGGNFMVRTRAFEEVGGFNADLASGEEAELCARLVSSGWKVVRVADVMGVHDSGIDGWRGWWRRRVRNGYGQAASSSRAGTRRDMADTRRHRSSLLWGVLQILLVVTTLAALACGAAVLWIAAGGLAAPVAVQFIRIAVGARQRWGSRRSIEFATFCMVGKVPESIGAVQFWTSGRSRRDRGVAVP